MQRIILTLLSLLWLNSALAGMSPFSSDGCTLFPEGSHRKPDAWAHCCLQHDLLLWAGGLKDERPLADRMLQQCVADAGYPRTGHLMFLGIRFGARTPIRLKGKTWGNGRPADPAYSERPVELLSEMMMEVERSGLPHENQEQIKQFWGIVP